MHIPKGTTAQLELVTFRQALAAADTPNETPIFTRNTGIFWAPGAKIR